MSIAHVVYIPFALMVGFYAGWAIGSRSVRQEWDRAEKRRKAREGA
jgi:hypothetical protein